MVMLYLYLHHHYFKNDGMRTVNAKSAIQSISLQLSLIQGCQLDKGKSDDEVRKMQLSNYFKYCSSDLLIRFGNKCPQGIIIFDVLNEYQKKKRFITIYHQQFTTYSKTDQDICIM